MHTNLELMTTLLGPPPPAHEFCMAIDSLNPPVLALAEDDLRRAVFLHVLMKAARKLGEKNAYRIGFRQELQ